MAVSRNSQNARNVQTQGTEPEMVQDQDAEANDATANAAESDAEDIFNQQDEEVDFTENEDNGDDEDEDEEKEDTDDEEEPSVSRSGRVRRQTKFLDPSMGGKSHSEKKTSSFMQAERVKKNQTKENVEALEVVHNLLTQAVPMENKLEYERDKAGVVAANLLEIRRRCLQQQHSMMQVY